MHRGDKTVYEPASTIADGGTTLIEGGSISAVSQIAPISRGMMLLDTYRVESDAIEGGMGSVWRVHHTGWNVDLAMKRPKAALFITENQAERFSRECEAWINLGLHPNIVSCYYVRSIQGVPSIFSEWMDGGGLNGAITTGDLYKGTDAEQHKRILDIAIQFARGLHYAHEAGLIHQDVKPDNLLLNRNWEAKVADFGLVQARAQLTVREPEDGQDTMHAHSGGYTPVYCSMEQMDGKPLTRRTDIYSWAVSVMEMYIGSHPWANGVVAGLNCRRYFEKARVRMPETIKVLLQKCMESTPENRPHDFAQIEAILHDIYQAETGDAYPRPIPKVAADTGDSLNNRALSMLDIGKPDEAEKAWETALAAEPSQLLCAYNQSLYLWRQGRIDDIAALGAVRARENTEKLSALLEAEFSVETLAVCGEEERRNIWLHSIALSHDGKTAVLTDRSDHPQCYVLNAETLKRTQSLYSRLNKGFLNGAVFLPGNRQLITCGLGGIAVRWEVQTGKPVDAYLGDKSAIYPDERLELYAIDALPDGSGFVFADAGGKLILMRFAQGEGRRFVSDSDRLTDVHVSTDGRLAAASGRKKAYLWEIDTGRLVREFLGHDTLLTAVRLTPDSKTLITGDWHGVLKIWSVSTGQCIKTILHHTEKIQALDIDSSGSLLLSSSENGTKLHELKSGRCLRTYEARGSSVCARFAPDGRSVFVLGFDSGVARYTLPHGAEASYVLARVSAVEQVSKEQTFFNEKLSRAKEAYEAEMFDDALGFLREARSVETYRNTSDCLALNFALSRHCTIAGVAGVVPFRTLPIGETAYSARASADADVFVTSEFRGLRCWRWDTGELKKELRFEESMSFGMSVSRDFKTVAYGTSKGDVCLLDVATRSIIRMDEPYHKVYTDNDYRSGAITSLAFSADSRWIYSGSDEGNIDIWDVQKGCWSETLCTVTGDIVMRVNLCLSPNGETLLIAWDDKVLIADPVNASARASFAGGRFTSCFYQVKMTPDASFVLTEDNHHTFCAWEPSTGSCLAEFEGAKGQISEFTADGRFVMIGTELFDMERMACVYDLAQSVPDIKFASISARGDSILIAKAQGKELAIWRIDYLLR